MPIIARKFCIKRICVITLELSTVQQGPRWLAQRKPENACFTYRLGFVIVLILPSSQNPPLDAIPALELPFPSCCLSQDSLPPSGLMLNKEKDTKVAASDYVDYVRKSDPPCLPRRTEALYKRHQRAIMF